MELTKMFILNSKDRLPNSVSSTDCVFQFNAMAAKSCTPVSFAMPLTQYNINSSNYLVYFNDGTTTYPISLTYGNYSVYDFIIELEAKLNAALAGFTVTYSDISMKLTIANLTPFRFMFATYSTNSTAYLMGFNATDGTLAVSQTSDNCIDLSLPLYVCCNILEFSKRVESSNASLCTFVFPSKANGGDLLLYSEMSDFRQCAQIYEDYIQSIRVRFTYPNGEPLSNNNNDWVMILRLCY